MKICENENSWKLACGKCRCGPGHDVVRVCLSCCTHHATTSESIPAWPQHEHSMILGLRTATSNWLQSCDLYWPVKFADRKRLLAKKIDLRKTPSKFQRLQSYRITINKMLELSQRDRTAGCISFGQKWKTGTGRQYFTDYLQPLWRNGPAKLSILWKKRKIRAITPFKGIEVGTNRKPVCDFLLVINSNWHPISYRFRVIAAYWSNFGHCVFELLPPLET